MKTYTMNPRFLFQTLFSIFVSSVLVSASGAAEGPLQANRLVVHENTAVFMLEKARARFDAVGAALAINDFMDSVAKEDRTRGNCQIELAEDADLEMLYVILNINNKSYKFDLTESEVTGTQPGVLVTRNSVKVSNGGREFPNTLSVKKNRSGKLIEVQVIETLASTNGSSQYKEMRCSVPIREM